MLHARHYKTQKSETTLVSLAHRIRFSCYSHNDIDIPKRTSCRYVLELKRIYQIRYAKT